MDDYGITSRLGLDLQGALCPGMFVPPPFEKMFRRIEQHGFDKDYYGHGAGHLFREREMRESQTEIGRFGGTDISFEAEGTPSLELWFGRNDETFDRQLGVFSRIGHDGSMAAFWLTDEG